MQGTKSTVVKTFNLNDTRDGKITVCHLDEPYGEKSKPVVSIGISLKGNIEDPDWKAHIPYENIDDLVAALIEAKNTFN